MADERIEKGYSIVEAAQALGIKVSTLRRWAQSGKIQASQIPGSRRWLILESEIKRLQNKAS